MNIGALYRAAIDAWMCDLSPSVFAGWHYVNRIGDVYITDCRTHMVRVFAPDPTSGEGGAMEPTFVDPTLGSDGYWIEDPGFTRYFESIRMRIRDALAIFDDIPAEGAFDPYMERLSDIAEMMRVPPTNESKATYTGPPGDGTSGTLPSVYQDVEYIEEACKHLTGLSIYAFQTQFLDVMQDTLTWYCNAVVLLGAALGGESNLWKSIPQSVDDAVSNATKAFTAHADRKAVDWKGLLVMLDVMLNGLQTFLDVISIFQPEVRVFAVGAKLAKGGLVFVDKAVKTKS